MSLTPELEKFVHEMVTSGRYASASEVMCEALRRLQDREVQLKEFNRELQRRIDSLDRGEFVTPEESRRRLQERSEQRRKRGY